LGDLWLEPDKFYCGKDKTRVPGFLLVDDKPDPTEHWNQKTSSTPQWRHVVFTQPYNVNDPKCVGKPRMENWTEWKDVLLPLLKD